MPNLKHLLQSRIVITIRFLYNLLIRLLRRVLFKKHSLPNKILIFRTGSIGDAICAFPALSNIRDNFPNAEFHLLTNAGKGYKSLVSIEKLIKRDFFSKIINYESLEIKGLTASLKHENYDLIIQLPQYNASFYRQIRDMAYFRLVVGIHSGFGWRIDGITFFKKAQEKYIFQINERDRLIKILLSYKLKVSNDYNFPFEITDSDISFVENQLNLGNIDFSKPIIGVVVGAKRSQNRWPINSFGEVVKYLEKDYQVFFLGGPEDKDLVETLIKYPHTYSFCGKLTPIQSGLIMQHCKLVLTNDTGPMHLAYAFGVPVLALFSNRDFPHRWYPPMDGRNKVLRSENIHCSICLSEQCADNICMKRITPAEVINTLNTMLSD